MTLSDSQRFPAADSAARFVLPGFEGPLDLLLSLIERKQMEITSVSILAVADQFIEYIQTQKHVLMEHLADFAAMASRLLYIKSRALLPKTGKSEEDAEILDAMAEAEEIRRNLLEYKLAKEIAAALRQRDENGLHTYARLEAPQNIDETIDWKPPVLSGLSVKSLTMAYEKAIREYQTQKVEELPLPVVTVAEKIECILAMLAERERFPLSDLFALDLRRIAIAVAFIAALELLNQQRIAATQDEPFGEIYLCRKDSAKETIE